MKQRRGIGTVITTLIILIASVVLGAGVIFFGGSLFERNTESESIQVSNAHIWVDGNGTKSVAGFVVQNTGGKIVSVQKITVRGQSVPLASWYFNNTQTIATPSNIQTELKYDGTLETINVSGGAPEEDFSNASGAISLAQGQAMFIYLANPGAITALDAGQDYTMTVQAGQANAAVTSVHVSIQ